MPKESAMTTSDDLVHDPKGGMPRLVEIVRERLADSQAEATA